MNPFRGLFGSSGRDYVHARSNDTRLQADPNSLPGRQDGNGAVLKRMPTLTPDLETPRQDRAKKWQVIGATMADVGSALGGRGGGSLDRVQAGWRAREAEEKAKAQMAQFRALAGELYGDDEESRLLFEMAPEKFIEHRLDARKPSKPVLVNTRLGPRAYNPETGEYRSLEDIPERLPPGYKYDEEGNVVVDPIYVQGQGALANVRAAATAAHRAPPRGGGGGSSAAPNGGRRQPWLD